MSHQYNQCGLAQQCRFTRHIWTRDHHDLLRFGVEKYVVGNIALAQGQLCLDDGVAALLDVEHIVGRDDRANIAILLAHLGKAQQAIDVGQYVGIDLYLGNILLHGIDEFLEEPCL